MEEVISNKTQVAKDKIESSSAHAKAAWDSTAEAAKQVSKVVKDRAQSVYSLSKEHLALAAQDLGTAATATYEGLKTQASEAARKYRGKAQSALDEASTKVKDVQSDTENYIKTNPLKAVGIAFGVGVVLGLILRR